MTQKRKKAKQVYDNKPDHSQQNRESQSHFSELNMRKAQKHKTLEETISAFHSAVSEGPIYICTCCDQLWYKHSVCQTHNIRLSTPNIVKYLQNTLSVNNLEWVCHTCITHLKKGKYHHLLLQME